MLRSDAHFGRRAPVWLLAAALSLAAAGPSPARADETVETKSDENASVSDYTRCLQLAAKSPATAREAAARWEAIGGGALARHCAAMALIGLGADREAAKILTEIGSAPGGGLTAADRASALRLAGGLWLRADQAELARRCFELAEKLEPGVLEARIGAARALAALGDYEGAVAWLTDALKAKPDDVEALTLRAAAYRAQKRFGAALADAEAATKSEPKAALAWFERGAAERAKGDKEAARESWLKASRLDKDGAAGDLARYNLQRMALGD